MKSTELILSLVCVFQVSAFAELNFLNNNDKQENLTISAPRLDVPGNIVLPANLVVKGGTFKDGSDSVNDSVRAGIGRIFGRWYWEINVLTSEPKNTYNSIGLGTQNEPLEVEAGTLDEGCSYHRNGFVQCKSGTFRQVEGYAPGDVIGLAYDGYTNKLYISKNGQWIVGDPKTGRGALRVKYGVRYFPMLTLSTGDSFLADFGQIAAKNRAPAGYEMWRR